MDPISLIVAALAVGGAAALQDTAGQAVKDAYAGLKSLLRRRFGGDAFAESVIERHEQNPKTWEGPLREQLNEINIGGGDDDVVAAARTVLQLTDPEGIQAGKYIVHISGGQGAVVGDHSQVSQTFNNAPNNAP